MPTNQIHERAVLRRNAILRTWLLGGALVVFGLLHLLKRGEGLEGPVLPFAAAWAVGALLNLGLVAWALKARVPHWAFPAEKVFDLLLVTALTALTGGSVSPLTALYFLVAFSAQLDLSRGEARWTQGGAVVACYAAEMLSSGFRFADHGAWVLWSVVFLLVTSLSLRAVSPFRKSSRRYEHLQSLRREADALLRAEGHQAGFPDFLLGRLVELFDFQHGALLRYDASTRELNLKASVRIPPDGRALLFRQSVGANAQGVGVYAAVERRTTFLREPATNPKLPPILRRIFEDAGSDRLASVPMVQGSDLIGVALLSSVEGTKQVEDEEVAFLEFTCSLVGAYLERWEAAQGASPPSQP